MAQSAMLSAAKVMVNHQPGLMQAQNEAARKSALPNKHLSPVFEIDVTDTQKQGRKIGAALERLARVQRASGSCCRLNHTLSKPHEEMLKRRWLDLINFQRLSHESEANLSPRCSDIAVLAADIERHLNLAEEAQQNKYWGRDLTNTQ